MVQYEKNTNSKYNTYTLKNNIYITYLIKNIFWLNIQYQFQIQYSYLFSSKSLKYISYKINLKQDNIRYNMKSNTYSKYNTYTLKNNTYRNYLIQNIFWLNI